jgi:hypothetical protein
MTPAMKPHERPPSRTFFLKTLNVLLFLSQRRIFLYDSTMKPLKNPSLEGRVMCPEGPHVGEP